jgi:hypothetical protein
MLQLSPETRTKLLGEITREENKPATAKAKATSIAIRSGTIDLL